MLGYLKEPLGREKVANGNDENASLGRVFFCFLFLSFLLTLFSGTSDEWGSGRKRVVRRFGVWVEL